MCKSNYFDIFGSCFLFDKIHILSFHVNEIKGVQILYFIQSYIWSWTLLKLSNTVFCRIGAVFFYTQTLTKFKIIVYLYLVDFNCLKTFFNFLLLIGVIFLYSNIDKTKK